MGCIYMRTDPNGKSYIGQTSFTEEHRWKEHCYDAFHKTSSNYETPLCRSIRKHGSDNFVCKILEDNICDSKTLNEREIFWISVYNTFENGLNATRGGEGNCLINTSEVKKLWEAGYCVRDICLLMHIDSATALNHLGLTPKEAGNRGPVYKTKNSMKHFGDHKIGRASPVSCYDMKTGCLIKEFRSYYEASKYVNSKNATAIIRASRGEIKSAFGYYWKEGNGQFKLSKQELSLRRSKSKHERKPVVCIETGVIYQDACYAQELTGICYRSISFTCNKQQKTAGGFHWKYATYDDIQNSKICERDKQHKLAHNIRKVICVETHEVYDSLTLASKAVGLTSGAIWSCCKGKIQTAGGYHWKYVE